MGHMYLIIIDSHSKWLDVQIMQSISTSKTVEKLWSVFATHGLPQTIVSDNDHPSQVMSLRNLCKLMEFRHIISAPYHLSTNGLAERCVQTVKQGLKQRNKV